LYINIITQAGSQDVAHHNIEPYTEVTMGMDDDDDDNDGKSYGPLSNLNVHKFSNALNLAILYIDEINAYNKNFVNDSFNYPYILQV